MRISKGVKDILFFGAVFILVAVILISGFRILENTLLRTKVGEETVPTKTIYRDDVAYFPRQDITTVLVLGIDRYGAVEDSGTYQNPGAADMAMVVILDHKAEECRVLQLNRDTMVNMPVLGMGGRKAGTAYGQLALAHTYGNGLEDSCENVEKTVSDFLYGISMDYYVAMNMDAIPILNDAVGGVQVYVREDFSQVDATIPMGATKLMGEQSINFVRTRKDVGDQLNLSRIQRQKDYVNGFVEAFTAAREADSKLLVNTYEDVADYLVTNLSVNSLTGMMDRYSHYPIVEVVSMEGQNLRGEEFYEFYPDEEAKDALILRLFFAPKRK